MEKSLIHEKIVEIFLENFPKLSKFKEKPQKSKKGKKY